MKVPLSGFGFLLGYIVGINDEAQRRRKGADDNPVRALIQRRYEGFPKTGRIDSTVLLPGRTSVSDATR
jgi:hypothetical protein